MNIDSQTQAICQPLFWTF